MKEVVVYSRPGCHLCEEAIATLRDLRSEYSFDLSEIDIEHDDQLLKRYQWRIPVVDIDGIEVAAAPISVADLRMALASA